MAPPPPKKKKVHQPTLLLEVTLVAEHQCFQGKQMQAHTQLHMSFPQMTYMPKDVAGEAAANYRRRDGCWGGGEWNDNTLTMEDTGRLSWLVFNQEVGNWQDQPGNIERVQVKITYLYNIHIYIS